ncbi:MAG: class I SAM-dependent rRNA methyltransferase, partial [Candidatus Cryptobacteroides sp.]
MIKVILKKGREESLYRFHPWVFSGAIAQVAGKPSEGDIVAVHSSEGEFLACGHWQIGSIAVRILSFDDSALRPDFWEVMLSRALEVRRAAGLASDGVDDSRPVLTNCYRLVHGEGDNLPGLIVDYYDGVCVLQAHSVGMFRAKKQISEALKKVYGDSLKAVYDKSSGTAPFKAGLELIDGYLY